MASEKLGGLLNEHEMLKTEEEMIWGKEGTRPVEVSGIALSGGGVRAAAVALGVLQSLANQGILSRFTYISTVSGGGYIASALQWFWSDARLAQEKLPQGTSRFGSGQDDFPFQDPDLNRSNIPSRPYGQLSVREKAVANLNFLRNNASYLTSGEGIGFAALIIAVVRTILVSLIVWFPILVAAFWLIGGMNVFFGEQIRQLCNANYSLTWCNHIEFLISRPIYWLFLSIAAGLIALFVLSVVSLSVMRPGIREKTPVQMKNRIKESLPFLGAAAALGLFDLWYFWKNHLQVGTGTAAVLILFIITGLFAVGVAKLYPLNTSYLLRRAFDRWSHKLLPATIITLFIGAIPYIVESGPDLIGVDKTGWFAGSTGGVLALLSGVSTALYGYYVKTKSIVPGIAGQVFAVAGAILFLTGLVLFAFVLAERLGEVSRLYMSITIMSLFFIAITLGLYSSVNATGLHRFYRDRLMESFMPMADSISSGKADESHIADTLLLSEIWDNQPRNSRPYHLINAHAILIKDTSSKVALRGGDNFTMSAAVVGSSATGWMKTSEYIKGSGPLTLASAIAASGAAANANAGYIGTGITRERFVSAVMAILNIRLGLWLVNPGQLARSKPNRFLPPAATYFGPTLTSGIFGRGYKSNSRYVELSDGGHFENLGLYELIRRKAALVLAVDAEQDEAINLSSLVSSTNRVREDFGASIEFLEKRGPALLIGQESLQYPGGVKIAQSPYIVGKIKYNDGTCGVLIYVKATMISGLDFATDGYRAANPDFPHQTTVDQLFDPQQFEAYRDLGCKSANLAIKELGLRESPAPDEILRKYGFEEERS